MHSQQASPTAKKLLNERSSILHGLFLTPFVLLAARSHTRSAIGSTFRTHFITGLLDLDPTDFSPPLGALIPP